MANNELQSVRGMRDILPSEVGNWQYLENLLMRIASSYAYQEIRLPVVENVTLFKRTIGEVTDIVEKEMYTFEDRNGDLLALRPEGTAGCVRAALEHGLIYNQVQKFWYRGSMFRHERPQKGRYRSFDQFGLEAFGIPNAEIEVEMIVMITRLWKEVGLLDKVTLQLNSLGTANTRGLYRQKLVSYFESCKESLDQDSQRRLERNPLRILDSKNPEMQCIIGQAPQLHECLDEESQKHMNHLCERLDALGIHYVLNPRLVRGLDYYTRTVFEWVTDRLGAQGTLCAGGRYDCLVEMLGGTPTPAVGLAIGLDRVIDLLTLDNNEPLQQTYPHVYFILVNDEAQLKGNIAAEELRTAFPWLRIAVNFNGGNFKAQFKRADKSRADFAIILGEDELSQNKFSLKYLRQDKPQEMLDKETLFKFFSQLLF